MKENWQSKKEFGRVGRVRGLTLRTNSNYDPYISWPGARIGAKFNLIETFVIERRRKCSWVIY